VCSNNPCTEGGVENIQDVAFSMSLAELCATDNMFGIRHVFGPQEVTSCTVFNCGEENLISTAVLCTQTYDTICKYSLYKLYFHFFKMYCVKFNKTFLG